MLADARSQILPPDTVAPACSAPVPVVVQPLVDMVRPLVIDTRGGIGLFIGTYNGVFNTTDGGATWLHYKTGLPNARVVSLELNTSLGILAAGTHGRGMWEVIPIASGIDVTVSPPAAAEGVPLNNIQVGSFTDTSPSSPGVYTAKISWCDGAVTTGTITSAGNGGGTTSRIPPGVYFAS